MKEKFLGPNEDGSEWSKRSITAIHLSSSMGLSIVLEKSNRKKADERFVHQCANAEDKGIEEQKLSTHHLIGSDHKELLLQNPLNSRRKTTPSKLIALNVEDGGMVKRSPLYRGSREIRRMVNLRGGGKNMEPYLNDGAFLSFEFINSTPWVTSNESVEFPRPKKEPAAPLRFQPKSSSFDYIQSLPKSNMESLDLSFRDLPEDRSKISISYSNVAPSGSTSSDSILGICVQTEEINNYENDAICMLSKSFSEKVGISNSCHNERESLKSSQKTRFSPFKKMFDPVMKSKSLRGPSSFMEPGATSNVPDTASLGKYKVFPRSLLNDFSKVAQKIDNGGASDQVIKTVTSPVHLHAILQWEFNHGGSSSSYEFSVKDSEDLLSAKTWKTENAFNWVYTFHCCKMKSNNIVGHGRKNRHLQPSFMIGQMQVSCYLCSEVSEAGSMDNSVVTEFTLYDIAQARRSIAIERPYCPSEFDSDPSTSYYPWASAELQPNLEIASIVTQIPFTKKEAMENMQSRDNEECGGEDSSSFYAVEKTRVAIGGHSSPAYVKVVTPSGGHGLPNREEIGPSSLLDRWRFGGGCDCGGWDMGCPIIVFDNANNDNVASWGGALQSTVLFVKGKKEQVPALTITATGKGLFAVDFHAQLSALQAFSICIAILHSSEASAAIGEDNNKYKLYSHSLKLILEEEMRDIIEAVAKEQKRKEKRKVEQSSPSFFVEPPFSPMGRV